jgi:hypothetical protein
VLQLVRVLPYPHQVNDHLILAQLLEHLAELGGFAADDYDFTFGHHFGQEVLSE